MCMTLFEMKRSKNILIAVVAIIACASCATRTRVEYVDRETIRYVSSVAHDTLINYVHDSVGFDIQQRNETIYATKYKEHIEYRDKIVIRHDTCWRDSLVTEYKEMRVDVKKTPKWCYCTLMLSLIFILLSLYKLLRWLKIF